MSEGRGKKGKVGGMIVTQEEVQHRLDQDPGFVNLKRFDYSLERVIDRYPDGCPDHVIARALGISEGAVRMMYANIVRKLRKQMGVDPETGEDNE